MALTQVWFVAVLSRKHTCVKSGGNDMMPSPSDCRVMLAVRAWLAIQRIVRGLGPPQTAPTRTMSSRVVEDGSH